MKSLLSRNDFKYFLIGFFLMVISTWMQTHPDLDYEIQRIFYDDTHKIWWIQESQFFRLVLYTVPKILIGIASCALIYFYSKRKDPMKLKNISGFLFCMICIPTLVSLLKSKTNIHCPNDLSDFNGRVPFRSLFDFNSYKEIFNLYGNGNCFPGGHASGGYAFMSSYLILDDLYKKSGIVIGFLLGTYMGLYQMMKGAHFLSHSIFTIGFSLLIISLVSRLVHSSTEGLINE